VKQRVLTQACREERRMGWLPPSRDPPERFFRGM